MKALNRVVFAATMALGLAAASQAMAQPQLSGPNGTAASPKFRFLLAEPSPQAIVVTTQPVAVWPSGVNTAEMAASPKQQQMAAQSQVVPTVQPGPAVVTYQPTDPDGITASPKLRQLMEENSVQFQVAPLK